MRIVSYNILDGGEGRADPLAEVLEAQRADIIVLIEADNIDVLERISRRLDMDYVHAPGESHSVAVLSRWPILESVNHSASGPDPSRPRCLVEALIKDPASAGPGAEWIIGALHLHPRAAEEDEEFREKEIAAALDLFEHHRLAGRPHLLVGDFNANSPDQHIDPERCKESTREEWRRNGGYLPRTAIQKVLNAGYLDTLPSSRGDAAQTMGTFSTQYPGQRIDYLFSHGLAPDRLRSAWIEYDRLAKYASDHFPIGAAFG